MTATFEPRPWRKILCPIDFSANSRAALEQAAKLARDLDADLHLLHVCNEVLAVLPGGVLQPGVEGLETAVSAAEHTLADWRRDAERAGAPRVTIMVRVGLPARAILNLATAEHSDLIVMGTRGRTGLKHLFLGSVAEHVIREAPCPVLTLAPSAAGEPPAQTR